MAKIVGFKEIPLGDLEIGKGQVRLSDPGKDIDELTNSIRKQGLLEPILVAPGKTQGKYEIILGQRRFLAHQLLGKKAIYAGILEEHLSVLDAKILSITENLVRRDLNRKDLIDACTYLYKKYGTMKDVAEETGLPYDKVREYVKYDRLIPELKELVDKGKAEVKTALRAQDAASVKGAPDPQEAIKLAKEMSGMSGAQQKKIQKELESDPDAVVDDVIEDAKRGSRITQFVVTMGSSAHESLHRFAGDEETTLDEAASSLIEEGLFSKGYM